MIPSKLKPLIAYLDSLSSRVDLETLAGLLRELDIDRDELAPWCGFCTDHYQRNLMKRSDWYELVVLCWGSGQKTPIHDHVGSSCGLRVVDGHATETRYTLDPRGVAVRGETCRLTPGTVCASQDGDIHEVSNRETGRDLVTLHIYSPPIARFHRYAEGSDEVVIEELCAEEVGAARPSRAAGARSDA